MTRRPSDMQKRKWPLLGNSPFSNEQRLSSFWDKVSKGDGCWLWLANAPTSYGMFWNGQRNIYAHRFAYEATYGEIPPGMCACHRCDNPKCVRPDHLFLGTRKDNTRDMIAKGRFRNSAASKTHCAHGHPWVEENIEVKYGKRRCRLCAEARRPA
jgi:hypothetical protein